jgi:alpha-tubulin suppressor-like RCC1 family protein
VADVAGGKNHVVVLTEDGVVWTTGLNDNYQLGDTTQGYRPTWEQVFKF